MYMISVMVNIIFDIYEAFKSASKVSISSLFCFQNRVGKMYAFEEVYDDKKMKYDINIGFLPIILALCFITSQHCLVGHC